MLLPRVIVYVEEHRVPLALYRLNQGNQILVLSPSSRRMIKGLLVSSFHQFKKSVEVNYEPEKKSFLSVSFKKKRRRRHRKGQEESKAAGLRRRVGRNEAPKLSGFVASQQHFYSLPDGGRQRG